jgi:hypothetical protein
VRAALLALRRIHCRLLCQAGASLLGS